MRVSRRFRRTGLVSSHAAGVANIIATSETKTGSAPLTVNPDSREYGGSDTANGERDRRFHSRARRGNEGLE